MPWTLDIPIVSKFGDLDTVLVSSFIVDNINKTMRINYEFGFIDSQGDFSGKKIKHYDVKDTPAFYDPITGEEVGIPSYDFTDLVLTKPDGTKTWYENLKDLMYDRLYDDGQIGDGTLT